MERNPHSTNFFPFGSPEQTTESVQLVRKPEVQRATRIGMFVQSSKQIVLPLFVELDFLTQSKIDTAVEVFLCQKEGFNGVRGRHQSRYSRVAICFTDRIEMFMNARQQLDDGASFSACHRAPKPGPVLERVKAETPLVNYAALAHV